MHYQADSNAPIGDPILQQLQNTKTTISLVASLIFHIFFHTKNKIESGLKTIIASQNVNTYSESFDYVLNSFQSNALANFSTNTMKIYTVLMEYLNKNLKIEIPNRNKNKLIKFHNW